VLNLIFNLLNYTVRHILYRCRKEMISGKAEDIASA